MYRFKVTVISALDKLGLLDYFGRMYGIRWYVRHLKCTWETKRRVKGYQDKRYERLHSFEGKHEGKRCFIVCTGPSLTLEDVEALRGEYTFGLNSITKIFPRTGWRPTYYVIEDIGAYQSLEKELLESKMKCCFSSDLMINMLKPEVDFIAYPFDCLNHSTMRYKPSMKPQMAFSGNAYEIVYGAFTVAFSAIQLAVYMGFKEIYLIGCDCDYSGDNKHFIDYSINHTGKGERPVINEEEKMILTYKTAKEYADENGLKICNATRGGKLEVFDRVDFDELIKRTNS